MEQILGFKNQKKPFNSKWYSKKFNGPGIRYKVGISINTGYIVWYNGPYPAGMMPDTKIYFRDLRWILDTSKKSLLTKDTKDYSMS